jgi:trans-aconitate methyltransferase
VEKSVSTVFGEVASLYDAVRPDLPREITGLVLSFAGSTPMSAAEIGAGTGKATVLFAGRGFPITCVEPDPRMAARLSERLPDADVTVVACAFEDWQPPPSGVDLLYASLAWRRTAEPSWQPGHSLPAGRWPSSAARRGHSTRT